MLKTSGARDNAPMINVIGGKLTTYRRLAEAAMEKAEEFLGARGPEWTARAALPGGDFPPTGYPQVVAGLKRDYPFLDLAYAQRLARHYGTLARKVLGIARSYADLGRHFGDDLYQAEVEYLMNNEWAASADDVLWRRTKRGLHAASINVAALDEFIQSGVARHAAVG